MYLSAIPIKYADEQTHIRNIINSIYSDGRIELYYNTVKPHVTEIHPLEIRLDIKELDDILDNLYLKQNVVPIFTLCHQFVLINSGIIISSIVNADIPKEHRLFVDFLKKIPELYL